MKEIRLNRNQIIAQKEKLIIENFKRVSEQLGINTEGMADEKWASDGGYYSKPSTRMISRYDLELFKKYGNEIFDAFINKNDDGNFSSNRNNGYAKTIITGLINDFGYPIDYDTDEGETYYWLTKDVSPDELKDDIETIIANQYDKIVD